MLDEAERARSRGDHFAHIVVVLFERLLRIDQSIGGCEKVQEERPRRAQVELNGHVINRLNGVDEGEVGLQRADYTFGRVENAVECGDHIGGRERLTVVILHAFTKMEGVGQAALTHIPTLGQIGDDRPQAVNQVVPNQVVVHVGQDMGAAALVRVKVAHSNAKSCAQGPASFGVPFRAHHAGAACNRFRRRDGRRCRGRRGLVNRACCRTARGQRRRGRAGCHHLQKTTASNSTAASV